MTNLLKGHEDFIVMFEKEAEKRARALERCQTLGVYDDDESYARDLGWNEGEVAGYEEGFKDGAEFAYNKANEWHKVADGDLPKAGQKCYFIYSNFYGEDNKVIFSESSIEILTGVYTFILDEETGDETTETCFYDDINDEEIYEQEVYAWREIALPKEIKEND